MSGNPRYLLSSCISFLAIVTFFILEFLAQSCEEPIRHFPCDVLGVLGSHYREPGTVPAVSYFSLSQAHSKSPGLQGKREVLLIDIHFETLLLHCYFDLLHVVLLFY